MTPGNSGKEEVDWREEGMEEGGLYDVTIRISSHPHSTPPLRVPDPTTDKSVARFRQNMSTGWAKKTAHFHLLDVKLI